MPLLNYTTKVDASRSIGEIQRTLAKHGAGQVMVEYNEGGQPAGLAFKIQRHAGDLAFKLPVDTAAVAGVLAGQKLKGQLKSHGAKVDMNQAHNVAWRITKDWVEAQMAYLETQMVTMEEIFLPYMLMGGGKTLYEGMVDTGFYLTEGRGE